jgi:hypothetical protein
MICTILLYILHIDRWRVLLNTPPPKHQLATGLLFGNELVIHDDDLSSIVVVVFEVVAAASESCQLFGL